MSRTIAATLVADRWPAILTAPGLSLTIVGNLTTGDISLTALLADADQQLTDCGYTRRRWTYDADTDMHTTTIRATPKD